EQGRIADRGPQQSPEPVLETTDRVPRRLRAHIDPELQPAVPRKVLELHRANEDRRIEAFDRIETDVLDPVGEFGIEILPLDGVAGDALATSTGERRDELALQVHALDRIAIIPDLEALRDGRDPM